MKNRRPIWVAAAVILMAAIGATFVIGKKLGYWRRPFQEMPFDSATWLSGDDLTRGQMVRDLLDRGLFNGRPRAEVAQLVGEPWWRSDDNSKWQYSVDIGMDFFGSPWTHVLAVTFDAHGTVKDAYVTD